MVSSKNRDRLLTTDMSRKVMTAILAHRPVPPLLSADRFSVDGRLVKASASIKSFQPKAGDTPHDDDPGDPPGPDPRAEDHPEPTPAETASMPRPDRQSLNAEVDFRGEKRSNGPMPRRPIATRGSTRSCPAPAPCCSSSGMR